MNAFSFSLSAASSFFSFFFLCFSFSFFCSFFSFLCFFFSFSVAYMFINGVFCNVKKLNFKVIKNVIKAYFHMWYSYWLSSVSLKDISEFRSIKNKNSKKLLVLVQIGPTRWFALNKCKIYFFCATQGLFCIHIDLSEYLLKSTTN